MSVRYDAKEVLSKFYRDLHSVWTAWSYYSSVWFLDGFLLSRYIMLIQYSDMVVGLTFKVKIKVIHRSIETGAKRDETIV